MDEAPQDATGRQDAALLAWLNSLDVDIDRDAARDSVATWADPARLFRLCQGVSVYSSIQVYYRPDCVSQMVEMPNTLLPKTTSTRLRMLKNA
jgi:hypothetical protein